MRPDDIQTFDPGQSYSVFFRRLPHWTQAGTVCFITWRTADSMPRPVVAQWIAEAKQLFLREGVAVHNLDSPESAFSWKDALRRLPYNRRFAVQFALTKLWDERLDECHGACLLRRPELAQVVADSLQKFDGERYELTDFVVMPNHVHLLAAFPDEDAQLQQCASWKRYTAREINRQAGRTGSLWQEDAFDHLVRSPEQFEHYRRYIANNGPAANLGKHEYLWFSKP